MSSSSSSTRRQQQERDNEYISNTQEQHEATIRSIDVTKDNIRRSIEETRRETPRYSQTVTDFQNETADASLEIADNFLESQKEVINSMQSAWAPMAQRIGQAAAHYWTTTGITPFFSPREMADIYARTIGAMAEAYVASTRMATNMMFAGLEATRATTNYTRQNAKEVSRITSNTATNFAQAAKETVQVQEGEDEQRGREGGISAGGSSRRLGTGGAAAAAQGSTAGSFESKGGAATTTTTRTTYTSEGTIGNSGTGTGSAATTGTTGGTVSLSDTVPGLTGKTGKKF
jgi:hypothetical protein